MCPADAAGVSLLTIVEEDGADFAAVYSDADARLIASAPELLAAAKAVLDGLNARIDAADPSAVPVFDGIAELHDAISKATGAS